MISKLYITCTHRYFYCFILSTEMKTRQTHDIWTERKDQEEMRAIRKKHQGIRTVKKRQLAVLKPLKCRYCPWRFFSNTPSYLSHAHNHGAHIKSYWYKNSELYHPWAASEAVVQPRAICRPAYVKPNKPEGQCTENNNKCRFCGRCFTTSQGKTRHEKHEHLCNFCEKTFENAEMKKKHELKCGYMEDKKCRFCNKYFMTVYQRAHHEVYETVYQRAHHEVNEHLCNFCKLTFETAEVKTAHEKSVHICDFSLCRATFKNKKVKKHHILKCHLESNKCNFCSHSFTTADMRAIHEKSAHICNICDEIFENAKVKERHKQEHHSTGENNCCFCGQSFPTVYWKTLHVKFEHLCDICEKPFENATAKKAHKLEFHSMNLNYYYKCNFCSRLFRTGHSHSHHVKSEHICNCCEKTFENAEMKQSHQLECHGIKAVMKENPQCRFCSRYFTTAKGRAIHEKYEHICDFKYCQETFANTKDKKLHKLEYHRVEDNYKCRFCSKCFKTGNLKVIHEFEHICDFCGKTFDNASQKKLHEFMNHCTKITKCHDCGRNLTPARSPDNSNLYTQLYSCLFCKKIFLQEEDEKSSDSTKSTKR